MKIGMRTVKTALAVTICIVLSKVFNIANPFYACVAAIISMESTVVYSYRAGINRILGTILGVTVGLAFSLIKPGDPILAGIGIIIVIYLCNLFKWKKAIVIASTVFCIIMINIQGKSPLEYSINRTIDTFLGIIVAVLVNFLIYPPKIHHRIGDKLIYLKRESLRLFKEILTNNRNISLDDMKSGLEDLSSYIQLYQEEFEILKEHKYNINNLKNVRDNFEKIYLYLEFMIFITKDTFIDEKNYHSLNSIMEIGDMDFPKGKEQDNTEEYIIYNYNITRIIETITNINILLDL